MAGDIPGRTATLHLHADDPHAIHFALDELTPSAVGFGPSSECGSVVSVADLALILDWWLTRRGRHDADEPRPQPPHRVGGSVVKGSPTRANSPLSIRHGSPPAPVIETADPLTDSQERV
jgi:hypothetical protein